MNNRENAEREIIDFLKSDDKYMLLTGTNQYKKHLLVMLSLNDHCPDSLILFRTNAMQNICSFTSLPKQPKSGEKTIIGQNVYVFDSLFNAGTQRQTVGKYDYIIVYPMDELFRSNDFSSISNLLTTHTAKKIVFCTWTDRQEYDYSSFINNGVRHIVYDAIEENPRQHKYLLDSHNK